jgi:hypothetical protein
MFALDTPVAMHAISDPFDVERRGRDVKPLVECASVGVFRSIENPNQRPVCSKCGSRPRNSAPKSTGSTRLTNVRSHRSQGTP